MIASQQVSAMLACAFPTHPNVSLLLQENQVINYQLVQYRLFPTIVTAIALHFTGKAMYKDYEDNQGLLAKGDITQLAETHANSCGLKSYATITAAESIETCRRACGGHGYSSASGMGQQYADYLRESCVSFLLHMRSVPRYAAQVTWEGDRWFYISSNILYRKTNAMLPYSYMLVSFHFIRNR